MVWFINWNGQDLMTGVGIELKLWYNTESARGYHTTELPTEHGGGVIIRRRVIKSSKQTISCP